MLSLPKHVVAALQSNPIKKKKIEKKKKTEFNWEEKKKKKEMAQRGATHGKSYGLDADLEAKKAAKYDVALEKKISAWITRVTGIAQQGKFSDWLADGVVLCTLMNKLKPGSVSFKASRMPFIQMENIGKFLNAARAFGLKDHDMAMTVDFYGMMKKKKRKKKEKKKKDN
jgi:Calponin homology (CH) domain